MSEKQSNLDIWLVLVIIIIVFAFGGGLWIVGKGLDARLGEINTRVANRTEAIQNDMLQLREAILESNKLARRATICMKESAEVKKTIPAP